MWFCVQNFVWTKFPNASVFAESRNISEPDFIDLSQKPKPMEDRQEKNEEDKSNEKGLYAERGKHKINGLREPTSKDCKTYLQ